MSQLAGRGQAAVGWGLAFGLAAHALLIIAMESFRPEICDPEYGLRLHNLRARLAENPNGQLICMVGSSRVAMGLRPDQMFVDRTANEGRPVVFNFARCMSGPVGELIYVRRLLDDGIRPNLLFIEFWPPYLTNLIGGWAEKQTVKANRLQWRDLALASRLGGHSGSVVKDWFATRRNPWGDQRMILLSLYARGFLADNDIRAIGWRPLDRWGCLEAFKSSLDVDPEKLRTSFKSGHEILRPALERFQIASNNDYALREMLTICRHHGIEPVLLYLPESKECQSWYPADANAIVKFYLEQIGHEFDVSIVDARNWLADPQFVDGYHMSWKGAAEFSVALERKVIQPLLDRRPLPPEVLWQSQHSQSGTTTQP